MIKIWVTYLLLFISPFVWSQTEQDKYINSSQEKKSLNKKEWQKLRKDMIRDSRGLDESANPTDFKLKPQDISSEENPDGDYYQYKEEKEDGEYSSYPDTESEYNEEYSDNENNGGGGSGGYYNNDNEQQYGQNEYHDKEDKYNYGQAHEKEESEDNSSSSNSNVDLSWTKWLLLGLLVVLVAFLIYQIFIKTQFNETGQKVESIDLDELAPTQISKSELEIRLEKALAAENYRLAIRIYFIFIIKALSEKDWISWEKRKTNLSYLMEMRGKSSYNQFEKCVTLFEFSWYGNYDVNKDQYREIEPTFKNLLKEVEGQQ